MERSAEALKALLCDFSQSESTVSFTIADSSASDASVAR